MLSRKYYKVIAQCIKDSSVEVVDLTTQDGESTTYIDKDSLINDLCDEFLADNRLFDSNMFTCACDVD